MKRPELRDFDLTEEEYDRWAKGGDSYSGGGMVIAIFISAVAGFIGMLV